MEFRKAALNDQRAGRAFDLKCEVEMKIGELVANVRPKEHKK